MNVDDILRDSQMEQNESAIEHMTKVIGILYRGLQAEGIPDELCREMVALWFRHVLGVSAGR